MPRSPPEFLHVDMAEVRDLCERVASLVEQGPWLPQVVVAVGRGGMVPARFVADMLGARHSGFVPASRHTGIMEASAKVDFGVWPTYAGRVLYVDDLVGDGATLSAVELRLAKHSVECPHDGDSWRTAALVVKDGSRFQPDYAGTRVGRAKWVVFPWELRETHEDIARQFPRAADG